MPNTRKIALMWKLTLLDGRQFGVTNHDRDIDFEGLKYNAKSAFDPSEMQNQLGLQNDNMDIIGSIDNDIIRAQDIQRGLYDQAEIEYFSFDWEKLRVLQNIFSGVISSIEYSENVFRAELSWNFSKINHVFGRSYTEFCSARFCDQKCGLDDEDFSIRKSVLDCNGASISIEGRDFSWPLKSGRVEFIGQREKVAFYSIKSEQYLGGHTKLELWSVPKFEVSKGDAIRIIAGCDKSFKTCQKFGNAPNFRGFPHMPGEEIERIGSRGETGSQSGIGNAFTGLFERN